MKKTFKLDWFQGLKEWLFFCMKVRSNEQTNRDGDYEMLFLKWKNGLLIVFVLFSLVACEKEVHQRDTIVLHGLMYQMGADEPFTGIVVGKGREGYRRAAYHYRKEFKNGVQNGETVFLYDNGKLESRVPYKNGKINGFVVRYWRNGRPKARIHFQDGLRGGLKGEMFWDQDGRQVKS